MDIDREILVRIGRAKAADPTLALKDFQLRVIPDGYVLLCLKTGEQQFIAEVESLAAFVSDRAA